MGKRSTLVVFAFILVLVISGCTFKKEMVVSDAKRFRSEYENSIETNEEDQSNEMIPEDNPFVYATAGEIITMMDNNESFVVYFGYANCVGCHHMLPVLIDAANDLNISKIYYVDVDNIRDELTINSKGEVITVKEASEGYLGLLNRLDSVLMNYTLSDGENTIKLDNKRIYAPSIVSIVNGKAKQLEMGISKDYDTKENVDVLFDDIMKEECYKKIYKALNYTVPIEKTIDE